MAKELLTETFSRLTTRLRAVAGRILKNDDDIADALQEAFCRLWNSRQPESPAEAEGRCVVTVRRVSIDAAIRSNRMADLPDDPDCESGVMQDETDIAELRDRLLESLPPMQRQVFELVALRDFDYDIAAERLGISEQAARTNLSRARKRLRELYSHSQI